MQDAGLAERNGVFARQQSAEKLGLRMKIVTISPNRVDASIAQDAQNGCPARPQRAKTGSVPSGAHGATNKEHHVCARRRVCEAAGSPLRI
jgi:hypothetical protein